MVGCTRRCSLDATLRRRSHTSAIARDRLSLHLGSAQQSTMLASSTIGSVSGRHLMRILASGVVCGLHSCRLEVHCGRAGASPRRRTCGGTPPPCRPTALPIDRSLLPPMAWPHALVPGRPGRRSPRTRACTQSPSQSPPRPRRSWFLTPSLAPIGARAPRRAVVVVHDSRFTLNLYLERFKGYFGLILRGIFFAWYTWIHVLDAASRPPAGGGLALDASAAGHSRGDGG